MLLARDNVNQVDRYICSVDDFQGGNSTSSFAHIFYKLTCYNLSSIVNYTNTHNNGKHTHMDTKSTWKEIVKMLLKAWIYYSLMNVLINFVINTHYTYR